MVSDEDELFEFLTDMCAKCIMTIVILLFYLFLKHVLT